MAEAFLNDMAGDSFIAESAGLEPGKLNPLVVESMKEIGIDISGNSTKSAFDMFKNGRTFDHVIAVCDDASAEKCPVFPGIHQITWAFPDPSTLTGTREEKMEQIAAIRDRIKNRIENWIKEFNGEGGSE